MSEESQSKPRAKNSASAFSRRSILMGFGGAAAVGLASALTSPAAASVITRPSTGAPSTLPKALQEVLDAWSQGPGNHSHIGDWRFVGHHRGESSPQAQVHRVTPGSFFGIRPNTGSEQGAAIQSALNALGAQGGGVLLLKDGTYHLDAPLFIHDSNVVLRGQSKENTILHFNRPLAESVGAADLNGQSGWSWTGGQIFFTSRERLAKSKQENWQSARGKGSEGWLPGGPYTDVAANERGTQVLNIGDSASVPVGEMVLLEVDNSEERVLLREIAGNIEGAASYDWANRAAAIATPAIYADFDAWRWPVIVTERVSPTAVRIQQPLKITIQSGMAARLRELGPTLHDSGVEELTIENELIEQTAHNQNPGSNGVCFQAVHDCWAKNVHVLNADLAFGFTSAKSCTLSGISAGGRSLHHFVACRVMSHDNLIEDFVLEEFDVPAVPGSYLHGLNLEGLSSGNVYRKGTLLTGTFDSHRQMPFENLRTDIVLTNKDAVPGGATNAGPFFGARTVYWSIHVTNDANLGMEISDIAGRSLNAGITGLSKKGSILPKIGQDFSGDLESICLEFGTDLNPNGDLLDLQRGLTA